MRLTSGVCHHLKQLDLVESDGLINDKDSKISGRGPALRVGTVPRVNLE